jgi:thiol-disulfide isomerase/thioredoxin
VTVSPHHLRLDIAVDGSRAIATHEEDCPDIGPICLFDWQPPQLHHTTLWLWQVTVLAEYGLVPNLAIQGVVPFGLVQTRTKYTDLADNPITLTYPSIHHRNETLVGPRDPQLLLHHGMKLLGFNVSERAGLSFPLGSTVPNPYGLAAEGLSHEHIQFGTGTLDPVLGLDLSRDFGKFSLAAFAFTQLPLYRDRYGYQAGDRFLGGIVGSSSLGLNGPSYRLSATVVQELPERWDGIIPLTDGNQGRTDLFIGPGITVPFATDWSVSVDLRLRAYGNVVGAQLDLPLVAEVSVGRLFHFENGREESPPPSGGPADVEDLVARGEVVPLQGVAGKWTVFDFWAPWCEACKRLTSELARLAAEDPRLAVRRVNIVDFDSPIAVKELPGVSVLPHIRVVAPDGRTAWEGSGTPDELLDQLRHQRAVPSP